MRISDWSSDVCSSDLRPPVRRGGRGTASLGRAGQGPRDAHAESGRLSPGAGARRAPRRQVTWASDVGEPAQRGKGHLILVVGPSGAGKDSLIDAARDALAGRPEFDFPRRIITRSSDPDSEEHDTLSEADFARQRDAGAFFLHWSQHGLRYALPGSIAG